MHRNRYENHEHRLNSRVYPSTEHFPHQELRPRPPSDYGNEHVNWDDPSNLGQDSHLEKEILAELSAHGRVDAKKITVKVENGIVTLTGTVSDLQTKRRAVNCAVAVPGVNSVKNNLNISKRV